MNYMNELKKEFSLFGFNGCPLSDDEIMKLENSGFSLDDAYDIGSDLYCCPDLSFQDIVAEYKRIEMRLDNE